MRKMSKLILVMSVAISLVFLGGCLDLRDDTESIEPLYTITFKDINGNVYEKVTNYQGVPIRNYQIPETPEMEGMSGIWYLEDLETIPDYLSINQDISLYPVYDLNVYQVTFCDEDGTVLEVQPVKYGYAATAPEEPTKAGNAQYRYEFAGWDKAFHHVTENSVIKATYREVINQYTVTYVDELGTVLGTSTVDYGTAATYAGETPVKAATVQYQYTFNGWDKAFDEVTEDMTVTAKFIASLNQYTYTFLDDDATVLKSATVDYGTVIVAPEHPVKASDAQFDYMFAAWTPTFVMDSIITGDITFTARYTTTLREYTVIFQDENGSLIESVVVKYGSSADAPVAPEKVGYTFAHWSASIEHITGDMTVTPVYTINQYQIYAKILVEQAGELTEMEVLIAEKDYASVVDIRTELKKLDLAVTGKDFIGWQYQGQNITEDALGAFTIPAEKVVFEAVYAISNYLVSFYNGTQLLTSMQVEHGSAAVYEGDTPVKAQTAAYTYAFSGWDQAFNEVLGVLNVYAQFTATIRQYTVTFVDEERNILDACTIDYGSAATYHGELPTKLGDAQYRYAFAGWDQDITSVIENMTVVVQFEQLVNQYTYIFRDYNNRIIKQETLNYGTIIVAPVDPIRTADAQYTYAFSGWSPVFGEGATILADTEYIATYEATLRSYQVTFVIDEGTLVEGDLLQTIEYGSAAVAPIVTMTGYRLEWQGSYDYITGETIIRARWIAKEYRVTIQIGKTSVTYNLEYGQSFYPPKEIIGNLNFTGILIVIDSSAAVSQVQYENCYVVEDVEWIILKAEIATS